MINSSGLSSQNEREIWTQQCLKAIFQLNEVATAIFDFFFFFFLSPLREYFKTALRLYFESLASESDPGCVTVINKHVVLKHTHTLLKTTELTY